MRRLLWLFGWVGVAIWSLVAFAVYGLLDGIGQIAMRHADVVSDDPNTVEWTWRVLSWLHGLSTSLTLVVWGVVTLAILSVPWLFDRLAKASVEPHRPGRGRDGIIDLAPGDYVVRPREEAAPPGPVPRIGRTGS